MLETIVAMFTSLFVNTTSLPDDNKKQELPKQYATLVEKVKFVDCDDSEDVDE